MVGGDTEVSRFIDPTVNEEYDVQLRLRQRDRERHRDDFASLRAARRAPAWCVWTTWCRVESTKSASRIDRLDRQRQVSLRAQIAPGYALADRIEALQASRSRDELADRVSTSISGRGRELERTFTEFLWAFLLSIIFMYMILASQFESTVHPLTILLSLPLSVPFALLSLWVTGDTLNLYSALGVLVLFGVVKKNSILQIDHMNRCATTAWNECGDHAGQSRSVAADPDDDARAGRRHAAARPRHRPRRGRAPLDRRRRYRRSNAVLAADAAGHAGGLFDVRGLVAAYRSRSRRGASAACASSGCVRR